ncbi:MAG: hypothetical protein II956_08540 [Bacteroidales bacterium]|nr:hypothetical protein [Bacteroidales bacterium]
MPNFIEKFLNIFVKKETSSTVTISNIKGAFIGSGIGESLGLPVKNKTEEELSANPVSDFLGYGDISEPGGVNALCYESLSKYINFLSDNNGIKQGVKHFFGLCNIWYNIKVKDEDQRLRIIIPCACIAGVLYSFCKRDQQTALNAIPDILCDEVIAPAAFIFYVSYFISLGSNPKTAVKQSWNKTKKMLKKIGLKINHDSFTATLHKILTDCFSKSFDFKTNVLFCVNKGFYPDLTGNIAGFFSGLFCGLENIPYIWSGFLQKKDAIETSAVKAVELSGVLA